MDDENVLMEINFYDIILRYFYYLYKFIFDRVVVVYVYVVKNDLINWELNFGLDKFFMINGEFLEFLELNENNILIINGIGEDL